MRWSSAANRNFADRVASDIVAILQELLHFKACRQDNCSRCAPGASVGKGMNSDEMFGKRYRDLSPAERRAYHRDANERYWRRRGRVVRGAG